MECGCRWIDLDGDPPDWWQEGHHIARKKYTCNECGGTILPGQCYHRVVGRWGKEVCVYRTCEGCRNLELDLYCGQVFCGQLAEQVWDELGVDIVSGAVMEDEE